MFRLLVKTTSKDLDDTIFDIVRHMNIGKDLIKAKEQRHEVGELNRLAGQKAMKSFSFHSASEYCLNAISLFGEYDNSEEQYNCLMSIYDLALEPLFAVGNFTALKEIIQETLTISKNFEQKIRANLYLIRLLVSSGKYEGENS